MSHNESYDPATGILTVFVPFKLKRRGGRKLVIMPEGYAPPAETTGADETLLKALARARHWSRQIETGRRASAKAIAEAETINHSYVSRILRLTFLAPDIVEAIVKGSQPKGLELSDLMAEFPMEWDRQRELFGFLAAKASGKERVLPEHAQPFN